MTTPGSSPGSAGILQGVTRVVRVTDDETEAAMRASFSDTHNVAEGAAGAALAAILRERREITGKRIGVVFSGGNVDATTFARVTAPLPPSKLRRMPAEAGRTSITRSSCETDRRFGRDKVSSLANW
jgi:threonine synthase